MRIMGALMHDADQNGGLADQNGGFRPRGGRVAFVGIQVVWAALSQAHP